MNRQHHIEELKYTIEKMKREPVGGMISGLAKKYKIDRLQKKLKDLEKEQKKNHGQES